MSKHIFEEIPIGSLAFFRDKSFSAWLIRFWSRKGAPVWEPGGFNHVAIYLGHDKWLSAEPRGIRKRNLAFLSKKSEVVIILAHPNTHAGIVAAQEANKIVNNMESGGRYDFLGCAGFVLNRLLGIQIHLGRSWFCSEMCIYVWDVAMDNLGIPHSYREPADTTPNDLAKWAMANGFKRYE